MVRNQYSTTNYIKVWYLSFALLCLLVQWLLPGDKVILAWRLGILLLGLFGIYNFVLSLTISIVLEEDRLVINTGFGRQQALTWRDITRVEQRDSGKDHSVRIYSQGRLVFETSSRWIEQLDELTAKIVSSALLTPRGTVGDEVLSGVWDVWSA